MSLQTRKVYFSVACSTVGGEAGKRFSRYCWLARLVNAAAVEGMPKLKPVVFSVTSTCPRKGLMNPTTCCSTTDIWLIIEQEKQVFFKGVATGLPIIS